MIWSDEKTETRSLVRRVEVSKMSVVVVIVCGFSAWLALGHEYLIGVQSEEAVPFVYSDCLGVSGKKNMWMA